jgi:non-heme chloroperoxidase
MQRGYYSMIGGDAAAPPPGRGRAHCQLPAGFAQLLQVTADNSNGVPESALGALRASWCKDFPKWIADNTAPFFVPETSPAMMQWGAALIMQCPVQIAVACNKAMTTTDFRAELTKISMPALVIHGDRDVSAPLALILSRRATWDHVYAHGAAAPRYPEVHSRDVTVLGFKARRPSPAQTRWIV